MKENNLNKTKTYLVGHMQYSNGEDWRNLVKKELDPLGITAFDPYAKPFIKDVEEGSSVRASMMADVESGNLELVQEKMRQIRIFDLNLVDRSDFIIARIIPHIASWGSAEELTTSCRMKKPTFIAVEGGRKKTPLWLLGMFPSKYFYDSIEDVIDMVKRIDSGEHRIDSDRWRLLKKEYR